MSSSVPSGARVLLIDDDAVWRLLTASALHERGFEVHDLDSASDIVAQVDACAPDVVIVDAVMPDIDGFQACRKLRDVPRHEFLPILMLTGLDDEQAISAAYQAGASDFFIKSTHWALLGERLRYLISVSRQKRDPVVATVLPAPVATAIPAASAVSAPSTNGRDTLAESAEFTYDPISQTFSAIAGAFAGFGVRQSASQMTLTVLRGRSQPMQFAAFAEALRRTVDEGRELSFDLTVRPTSRQYRIIRFVVAPAESIPGAVVRGTLTDITHSWEAQEQIRRIADCDPLTGLASRAQFLSEGTRAIAAARQSGMQVAVAVINIDLFADVNERYGQSSGDELLCLLSARMSALFSQSIQTGEHGFIDDSRLVLSRLAGDCFAVMFPAMANPRLLDPLLEALHETIGKPFALTAGPCTVSASIGASVFPTHGDNAGLLLSRADRAMSAVKADGRNGLRWYSASLDAEGRSRIALASDLRRAIDTNELELFYQLVIDVVGRRIYGAEALMRWRKPSGLLQPVSFIPLAEETGLIIPMGEWAIGEACRQLAEWQRAGLQIRQIAVNLPSSHFERTALLRIVNSAVQGRKLARGALELELTETGLVRDIERTLPRFQALRDAGVSIAIDDFGTGYSNLAYLARLPVEKLKIDSSFVQAMADSPQAETIVRAIVGLGNNLNMSVVAEGVETEAQVKTLRGMGCHLMQGYYFARPVPAGDFALACEKALAALDALDASESVAR